MKVVTTIPEIRAAVRDERAKGELIGLVPTMGYLHEGHGSLIRQSAADCGYTVVSIFVNPTQFGPNEDFERYPRDLERDKALCEAAGADIIFAPSASEMYAPDASTKVTVAGLTAPLCGRSRPGHFDGVTTVVSKLFNIVQPDRAYFGQKDAQQVAVVKRMVRDLDFPIDIVEMPIVREADGLAMSSRNTYLTPEQRRSALVLSRSLATARRLIESGERSAEVVRRVITEMIARAEGAVIDYVAIVDSETLEDVEILKGSILVALAVKFGSTRLIDNMRLDVTD